jgi:hypothetical protein
MALLEGKSPAEKKKIIAAAVLGVVSLVALYMAFGRSFFGGSTTTATTKASPSPSPKAPGSTAQNNNQFRLPSPEERALNDIVPVVYNPAGSGAPDAGRNIFAFYEPPDPPPYTPPPPAPLTPTPTPVPEPPPPFTITGVTPNTRFAGTKGEFKLEVFGGQFTPDARIYFNQTEMPTQFVNAQALSAMIPEALVAQEGPRQINVQTPDGRLYSTSASMTIMPPPRPTGFQYIGMIGRSRYNNDTAYFTETNKPNPFGARLNDVIGGRFRVINISAQEVVVEDTSLGFKHRIAMTTSPTGGPGTPPGGGFVPYTPGTQPGMQRPGMVPQPPRPDQRKPPTSKDDVDDNDNP